MTENVLDIQGESTEPEEYKVGPGKPPKFSQWKPGQSGNPKGRPKGIDLKKILNDELKKDGRAQELIQAAIDHAIKGNAPYFKEIMARMEKDFDDVARQQIALTLVNIVQEVMGNDRAEQVVEKLSAEFDHQGDAELLKRTRVAIEYAGNGAADHDQLLSDPYIQALPSAQQDVACEIPGYSGGEATGQEPVGGGDNGAPLPE